LHGERVERRTPPARDRVNIRLPRTAWLAVHDEAGRHGDIEVGGGLYGARDSGAIRVSEATTAVRNQRAASALLDNNAIVDRDRWYERNFPDRPSRRAGEIGTWHTHPSGGGEPSPSDLATWLSAYDAINAHRSLGHYLGIIATPTITENRDCEKVLTWAQPELHAWAVTRDDHGCAVYEPAILERTR